MEGVSLAGGVAGGLVRREPDFGLLSKGSHQYDHWEKEESTIQNAHIPCQLGCALQGSVKLLWNCFTWLQLDEK